MQNYSFVFAFERSFEHDFLPEHIPRLAIEGQQHALFAILHAGGDENLIVPDNRRGMTFARQFALPGDVPPSRSNASARRFPDWCRRHASTPTGPVLGVRDLRHQSNKQQ